MILKILFILFLSVPVFAEGPLFKHKDVYVNREFQNAYVDIRAVSKAPVIYTGTTAPSIIPPKVGDIYINTTAGKVYIATATVTSASWAILN